MDLVLHSISLSILLTAPVVYIVALAVHRLYLSPVSKFPGPKLAALTFWYEFYYDVICKGRYTWKIQQLHRQYGPIIRINPFEIHVDDHHFYDEVYVGHGRRTDKWQWSAKMFGTSQAAVGTTNHELHRLRRSALNPFFSKRSVVRLEPIIHANVVKLRSKLSEWSGTRKPVNLSDAFTCLSADVIGNYAFGQSYNFINSPNFEPGWRKFMMDLSAGTMLMKQFGWAYRMLNVLPEAIISLLHPLTRQLINLRQSIAKQIRAVQDDLSGETKSEREHPTIFHQLLTSDLPPVELSLPRLTDEALTIIGAGTVTTAHTLTTITYHILSDPSKLNNLRTELATLTSDSPNWTELEHLPYLSACISEGLRLSYGVSHRLQRVSPDSELYYHDPTAGKVLTIPRGTPVSMTSMNIHNNPNLFPCPEEFLPERWLSTLDSHPSEARRWLVPFSRGSRSCVGMNLAYAELFLTIGSLFAPAEAGGVNMELFETDDSDVKVVHDFFNPSARLDSKGVRVLVS
ncbi:putative cytochrome P450 [Rhizodiscina lignyota]|uniref:Cytochrome P450 n=1 Tax=Rhizodiscina lignyota TaxID=1504668 RepID=A0A9P4IJJ5_9PEZI|nr:putative cytochrome P450 [Rhizodiscina lignyota]